jgi:hypothetical protein
MRHTTPTGDKLKSLIRKIDRWLLKQEDECTLDWSYQDLVPQFEQLLGQMKAVDAERKQLDRDEARERRQAAKAVTK